MVVSLGAAANLGCAAFSFFCGGHLQVAI